VDDSGASFEHIKCVWIDAAAAAADDDDDDDEYNVLKMFAAWSYTPGRQ